MLRALLAATALIAVHIPPVWAGSGDARVSIRLEERPAGIVEGVGLWRVVLSPDQSRLAYEGRRDGKALVVVDGVPGDEYDDVQDLTFSPDSKRVAYAAAREGEWQVVLDGTARGPRASRIGKLLFSPDGTRLVATLTAAGRWCAEVDGVRSQSYDAIYELAFSPDSTRFAFVAERGSQHCVVCDGSEGQWYDHVDTLVFSPDGSRLGYTAWRGSDRMVVVDGVEGPAYDRVWELAFSADGRSFGYGAARGTDWVLVVNGRERDGAGGPLFSPICARMAYRLYHRGSWRVVADGIPGPSYDAVWSLVFSTDGRQIGYAARRGTKVVPVVSGQEWGEYDRFRPDIVFAPDGSRAACTVRLGERWLALVDGVAGTAYDRVHRPAFDPTAKHVAYLAERDRARFLVVDGVEAGAYNTDYPDPGEIVFGSEHELRFIAVRGDSIVPVTARIGQGRGSESLVE